MNRRTLVAALTRRDCARGRTRGGADGRRLSQPADPHHRAAGRRLRHRHPGARAGAEDGRALGSSGRGGEPPRRQCHPRHGSGRQGCARRLHAGLCAGQLAHRQPVHLQEAVLRPHSRLCPDHPDRRQPAGRRRQSRLGIEVAQGRGGARQGHARAVQLRLVRHRQPDPHDGRAAGARRRHQDDARAVSRTDAGDHRRAGRTDPARIHHHGRRDGPHRKRDGSICSPRSACSATSSFPTCRPRPNWAIRAWSSSAGPACSRPPARRRRSSPNCTTAWRRRSPCPTSRTRS